MVSKLKDLKPKMCNSMRIMEKLEERRGKTQVGESQEKSQLIINKLPFPIYFINSALHHFLWIRCFSIQDRIGFYEDIMRISTQNNEEP